MCLLLYIHDVTEKKNNVYKGVRFNGVFNSNLPLCFPADI